MKTAVITCLVLFLSTWHLCAEQFPPVPNKVVAPIYPALAFQAAISGTVTIRATVSKAGIVTTAKMIEGHKLLELASEEAAKKWTFVRGEKNREVNLVFVFIREPANTPLAKLTTRYHDVPPWTVEVRRAIPSPEKLFGK